MGFDKEIDLKFDVKEDYLTREIPEYSWEDYEAMNGPSVVESLMAGDLTKDKDSDVNKN